MNEENKANLKESILKTIRPQLIAEQNIKKAQEQDIIVEPFCDLGIAYEATVFETPCCITKKLLDMAGIESEEIREVAVSHVEPALEIRSMRSIIAEILFDGQEELVKPECTDMYVIRASDVFRDNENIHGAVLILSEHVRKEILSFFDGSAYLLPSSTEEIIACPCSGSEDFEREEEEEELLDIIYNVNRSNCVTEQNFLSDNLYRLERDGRIEIITGTRRKLYEAV